MIFTKGIVSLQIESFLIAKTMLHVRKNVVLYKASFHFATKKARFKENNLMQQESSSFLMPIYKEILSLQKDFNICRRVSLQEMYFCLFLEEIIIRK